MAGRTIEERQILGSLVNEALIVRRKSPYERFYKEFVTQVLNYVWGKNYRQDWMDFTTEDPPFIDCYAHEMLVIIIEVLQAFRTDLPTDEARDRLDHIVAISTRTSSSISP